MMTVQSKFMTGRVRRERTKTRRRRRDEKEERQHDGEMGKERSCLENRKKDK